MKIVDKEAEIYEKMILLPAINEPIKRPSKAAEYQQETLLFKAPAVRLSTFLAKRQLDKREEIDR